jgi:hypothetical protein
MMVLLVRAACADGCEKKCANGFRRGRGETIHALDLPYTKIIIRLDIGRLWKKCRLTTVIMKPRCAMRYVRRWAED